MPEKKDAENVCIYLVLIGVIAFEAYKIGDFSDNKDMGTSWLEVSKQVVAWVAVMIFGGIGLIKTFKYRNSIKRWERKELQEYLDRNLTEQWLSRGKSGEIGKEFSEIAFRLPDAERRLGEVKRLERSAKERR